MVLLNLLSFFHINCDVKQKQIKIKCKLHLTLSSNSEGNKGPLILLSIMSTLSHKVLFCCPNTIRPMAAFICFIDGLSPVKVQICALYIILCVPVQFKVKLVTNRNRKITKKYYWGNTLDTFLKQGPSILGYFNLNMNKR
jgi:hypothetical protein